jgi:hypothetical protein
MELSTTYTTAVWTEELSETSRGSFQKKFEKLAHLVGFIIRICHDARSHERKMNPLLCNNSSREYYLKQHLPCAKYFY